MNGETDRDLYLRIKSITQQFRYIQDSGIDVEINEFLSEDPLIKGYAYTIDEESIHHLLIKVEKLDIFVAKDIFRNFVRSMEYGDATFYARLLEEESIHYLFFSAYRDGEGFYFEITFVPTSYQADAPAD